MSKTAILRTRIDPHHKAAAEGILKRLGVTPTQAVSMLYAQIVHQKAIPFSIGLGKSSRPVPTSEPLAESWGKLDDSDYSHLIKR
jgi:addiction module RelB/DinJ family antitoxin